MEKNEILIDTYLQDPQCTMISPGYKRPRDEEDMPIIGSKKIERNPDNLIKLENIVSQCMQIRYQSELVKTLDEKIPTLYIDCSQKGEDDIMFFIFREYIKQSQANDKEAIVTKAIGDYTILTQSREERKNHIQENKFNVEGILTHYAQLLKGLLQTNDDQKWRKSLLNFESDITFDGLARLMVDENQKYLYLYLDKTEILSVDEQQRINTFLYTRGRINHDRRIRVKINNGKGQWKTRISRSGHRVQATHDYSEITVHEDKL